MAKYKHHVLARTQAAERRTIAAQNVIGTSLAAIEIQGAAYTAEAGNGQERSLQAVSATQGFSALIKHGNTVLRFEGSNFAVSTHD